MAGLGYAGIQKKKAAEAASAKATVEAEDSNTVTWQGKTYKYNQNISNYLLLGVDKRTPAETRVGKADAGQADALFLLSLNRKTKEMTLISIPRDTMTDVESFDLEGKSLGKSKDHISLSYGIWRRRCQRAANSHRKQCPISSTDFQSRVILP